MHRKKIIPQISKEIHLFQKKIVLKRALRNICITFSWASVILRSLMTLYSLTHTNIVPENLEKILKMVLFLIYRCYSNIQFRYLYIVVLQALELLHFRISNVYKKTQSGFSPKSSVLLCLKPDPDLKKIFHWNYCLDTFSCHFFKISMGSTYSFRAHRHHHIPILI